MTGNTTRPKHLLSFVSNESGTTLSIHADLAGIDMLLSELQQMQDLLAEDDCPHMHLFTADTGAGDELTESKLPDNPNEVTIVDHVKIYGWNDEWAVKHGLRNT